MCFDINVLNSTSILVSMLSKITIFPNPTIDQLNIDLSSAKQCDVKIIDARGNIVRHFNTHTDLFTIDTGVLNPGIYLLLISNDTETLTKRFTKI
jgi:hypothetical protein